MMILRERFEGMTASAFHGGSLLAQSIAVIGFISKNSGSGLPFQKSFGLGAVANLSGGDDEAYRAAERVGKHMDLGGQSASGAPQRLILCPPFPLAAC